MNVGSPGTMIEMSGAIPVPPVPPGNRNNPENGAPNPSTQPPGFPKTELSRVLKERHVNMIAFSTCVGMGLFLQSGKVIFLVGQRLAFVVYLISGLVLWCVAGALGEMTALFPVKGGLFVFPRRFLDAGVGYAAGWMVWFSSVVIIASEVLAVAQLFNFNFPERYLSGFKYPDPDLGWRFAQPKQGDEAGPKSAIWAGASLLIMLAVNCLPVLWYGRLEYVIGIIKMIFVVGLVFFNVVVVVVRLRRRCPLHFDVAQNLTLHKDLPGHEVHYYGGTGRFLALWSSLTTVMFSMIGFEMISITAPENRDLGITETIKMGTRKIVLRITLLYALCTLVASLNVPFRDENLADFTIHSIQGGQHSAFILAAVRNRVRGWPNFFNGFFIFSATSAGVNWLYLSSRILHALAGIEEAWPDYAVISSVRTRLQRTHLGVPYNAISTSWLFGLLGFLSTNSNSSKILGRMAIFSAASTLIVYAVICLSYLEFYNVINRAARGLTQDMHIPPSQPSSTYNRDSAQYPYKSWGQWLKAFIGLGGCSLLVVFNGWQSFVPPFSSPDFVASYVGLAIFAVMAMAYHISLDGWDPRAWKRNVNYDLQHPPPTIVATRERVGRLGEVDIDNAFSRQNANTFGSWIWAWLK
ncbi:hypothetical protein FGG08_001109 [Glutinoglossum americanum]|uniref:Amino acid permease/ SLC12A domain-containing protein n=1 Tax=Glutinoglossum americanum TaxID=1670608 RepID=A0A9P8I8U7_9PEZI|nr:hypothetical protein FGG08_001109 [Glutinoglossum americanum]